jgi:parallel beta-helix repeat protein
MAKIATYPIIAPELSDFVIGTNANDNNETVNYRISDMLALITPIPGTGTVTSVAMTAPPAFQVVGGPVTGAGTLGLQAIGSPAQYIKGDGNLGTLPSAVVGAQFNTYSNYQVNDIVVGDGSGDTLAGLGISSGDAATLFPLTNTEWGGISVDTTYDSCVIQEAILTLGYDRWNRIDSIDNKLYKLNHRITIPNGKISPDANSDSYMIKIGFGCNTVIDQRSTIGPLFDKSPANESDAANIDVETQWIIENGRIIRATPALSTSCFRIGASKGFVMQNMKIFGFDTSFVGSLLLRSSFINNEFSTGLGGINLGAGWWTGATAGADISQPTINKNRFKDITGNGIYLSGCDTIDLNDNQFEGNGGAYGVFIASSISVAKYARIINSRFENESYFTGALIGFSAQDPFDFYVDTVYNVAATAGTKLIESRCTQGEMIVHLRRCRNSGGTSAFSIYNKVIGGEGTCDYDVAACTWIGQPKDVDEFLTDNGNVWFQGASYAIPGKNRTYFVQRLPKVNDTSYLY